MHFQTGWKGDSVMKKLLNNAAILTALLLSLSACRVFQSPGRESRVLKNQLEQHSKQLDLNYVMRRDSQAGYWLFWSDSTFRFHPDSGLTARSGKLLRHESRVSVHMQNKASTGVSKVSLQTADAVKKEKGGWIWLSAKWFVGLLLLAFVALRYRGFLKRIFVMICGISK